MGQAFSLVFLLQQCRSILCLHPVNVLSLWCFYRESLLLLRFLLEGRKLVGFPLWIESKALIKRTNSNVACRSFFPYTFKDSTDGKYLWYAIKNIGTKPYQSSWSMEFQSVICRKTVIVIFRINIFGMESIFSVRVVID